MTGARHTPPPTPPPPYTEPSPPRPPWSPFSECQNTCDDKLADGDTKCRDGGKGSFLPTVCEFSTNCRACGFRTNTQVIEQDNSCAHARNGVCEDGATGSSFVTEAEYGYEGVTSLCGLGTDKDDCAPYGERLAQQIGFDSFQGLSNYSSPTPPPPLPVAPSPAPPPLPVVSTCTGCRAWFKRSTATASVHPNLGWKPEGRYEYLGTCTGLSGECPPPEAGAVDLCSDGGAGAHAAVFAADLDALEADLDGEGMNASVFACPYGSQCSADPVGDPYNSPCGTDRRPRDQFVDSACSEEQGVALQAGKYTFAAGLCRDACYVETDGTVVFKEERLFDAAGRGDGRCHDGGGVSELRRGAVSNKCPYGTQSTRCGPSRPVVYDLRGTYGATRRALQRDPETDTSWLQEPTGITERTTGSIGGLVGPPPRPPPPPPPFGSVQPPPRGSAAARTRRRPSRRRAPPPSPSPPSPPPPPPPPNADQRACSCFTEDSTRNEGTRRRAGPTLLCARAPRAWCRRRCCTACTPS